MVWLIDGFLTPCRQHIFMERNFVFVEPPLLHKNVKTYNWLVDLRFLNDSISHLYGKKCLVLLYHQFYTKCKSIKYVDWLLFFCCQVGSIGHIHDENLFIIQPSLLHRLQKLCRYLVWRSARLGSGKHQFTLKVCIHICVRVRAHDALALALSPLCIH